MTAGAAPGRCPACGEPAVGATFYAPRPRPVLNNLLYGSREEALACPAGTVELVACAACGFVHNRAFDEAAIMYTADYDSRRSHSPAYLAYLDRLIAEIAPRLAPGARVLELGCGDGVFLMRLRAASAAQCEGYDANAPLKAPPGVRFHRARFDAATAAPFDLVVLRHVLEHIPAPRRFLEGLLAGSALQPGGALFVEVPAWEWIAGRGTYFDVTYEHCNYFTAASLARMLGGLGFGSIDQRRVFGDQYTITHARLGAAERRSRTEDSPGLAPELHPDDGRFGRRRQDVGRLIEGSENVCVWGCAGKGVTLLSDLEDGLRRRVCYAIDTHLQKQGKFLPVSGMKVEPPLALQKVAGRLTVLVMNGAYAQEIRQSLNELAVDAEIAVL